ncbi:MAG: SsrA-binding protein SmpB [Flavobacteriales bacterium]|nr:SsrA-binding protein SmpB [Schleiferiaceae bacterium]
MVKTVEIKNKRAKFDYEWLDTYTAGIQLLGTEVKSVRMGKASIAEGYCYIKDSELYIKNMNISEWSHGNLNNHDPIRERKLLLSKREIEKISKSLIDQGVTIVPTKMYISEKGWIKMNIAVARGKKNYDKRQSLKDKDAKRDLARLK